MFNLLPTNKKIGLIAAIIGTVFTSGGIFLSLLIRGSSTSGSVIGALLSFLSVIGFIATIISYVTGGFSEAIKSSLTVGKWGWLLTPFPYDIATGLISVIVAFYLFFACPIYPMYKSCKNYVSTIYE